MNWTRKHPTEPGWYWAQRKKKGSRAEVVSIVWGWHNGERCLLVFSVRDDFWKGERFAPMSAIHSRFKWSSEPVRGPRQAAEASGEEAA